MAERLNPDGSTCDRKRPMKASAGKEVLRPTFALCESRSRNVTAPSSRPVLRWFEIATLCVWRAR